MGAGLLLLLAATVATEHTQRWDMHQSHFYQVSAAVFLFFIISSARASVARWPATTIALVYTGWTLFMLVLMPLFAAQPLLGPIYVQVDHFMPTDFPLLLVVPALALDLVMQASARAHRNDWVIAAMAAAAFLVTFLVVQWPFADFLMTPWARNWFFVSHRMPYTVDPQMQARWYRLNAPDNLAAGLPIALVCAFVSARCGLWWGNWMARVQR
jgi:cell division protein FtsW (lipid II flippase)